MPTGGAFDACGFRIGAWLGAASVYASRLQRDSPFLVALDAAEPGKPAWVHCETLNTIPCDLLEERHGTLTPATMLRVDAALRHSLGLG